MQGDLISRTEVEKVVDELEVYTAGRLNTQKVEISVLKLQRLVNALKNIPTAYDVEKVVAELEMRRVEYESISENMEFSPQQTYYAGLMRGFEYSQDYVRNGGKE